MSALPSDEPLRRFLVEVYHPELWGDQLAETVGRVDAAARDVTRDGLPVHYLRAIFIPEDETCFYLYDGVSADAVEEANRRAAIPHARIVEAVSIPGSAGEPEATVPPMSGKPRPRRSP